MAVVLVGDKVTSSDLVDAREEYGDFVKFVVDVVTNSIVIGGEWHSDGEEVLRKFGSSQDNLWGGGIDLVTNEITYSAMTNIKPGINTGHVILDELVRKKFENLVKIKFGI